MGIGTHHFEQLDIELSAKAANACRGNPAQRVLMIEATRHLVTSLMSRDALPVEQAMELIQKADVDAKVTVSQRNASPEVAPLLDIILKYGHGHEAVFALLLDRVENPDALFTNPRSRFAKATKPRTFVALERVDQNDYLECLLRHPQISVEATQGKISLLTELCDRLSRMDESLNANITTVYDAEKVKKYTGYIHQLLDRGAVLDPEIAQRVLTDEEHHGLLAEAIKPRLNAYTQTYEDIIAGKYAPEAITHDKIWHALSIGHFSHLIHHPSFDGHAHILLDALLQLPGWMQEKYPMELELTVLCAMAEPSVHVHASSSEVSGSILPDSARNSVRGKN